MNPQTLFKIFTNVTQINPQALLKISFKLTHKRYLKFLQTLFKLTHKQLLNINFKGVTKLKNLFAKTAQLKLQTK